MNTQPNQQSVNGQQAVIPTSIPTDTKVPVLKHFDNKTYRIFKPIAMMEIMNIVKTHRKQKDKESLKMNSKLTKKAELNTQAELLVNDNREIGTDSNSIKDFLNTCHPDVRKYLNENRPHSIKASPGKLTIITKNNYQMLITIKGYNAREIIIKDKNRKIVCKEISIYQDKKKQTTNGNHNQ